jgi:hypothetical protein
MVPWWAILISLVAGALATSIAEYVLKSNLIDKFLDFFRSEEQKAASLIKRGETVLIDEAGKVRKA